MVNHCRCMIRSNRIFNTYSYFYDGFVGIKNDFWLSKIVQTIQLWWCLAHGMMLGIKNIWATTSILLICRLPFFPFKCKPSFFGNSNNELLLCSSNQSIGKTKVSTYLKWKKRWKNRLEFELIKWIWETGWLIVII